MPTISAAVVKDQVISGVNNLDLALVLVALTVASTQFQDLDDLHDDHDQVNDSLLMKISTRKYYPKKKATLQKKEMKANTDVPFDIKAEG